MLLRRFTVVGLITCSAIAWSVACSSDGETDSGSSGTGAVAGAAGDSNGSGSKGNGASTGSGGVILGQGGEGTGSSSSGNGGTGLGGVDSGTGGAGNETGNGGYGANVSVDGVNVMCGDHICECADGLDNDDDGVADGFDIECTGPADDDESSFATGIPGDNKDPHQDCFFDGDSGAGNDGCKNRENPSDQCIEFCAPRTSNGCDCFGCCQVLLENGSTTTVQLGGTCTDADLLGDPTKCTPCTQSEKCMNTCGECELCPGKTVEDLPESCNTGTGGSGGGTSTGGGSSTGGSGNGGSGTGGSGTGGTPTPRCDDPTKSCGSSADCPGGYCQLGCCVPIIIK